MKKFVNFKFVVMFALALVANVASYAQDNVIDEVVWVIGDEAILKSDVEEARLAALYEGRKFDGDPYCVIPEELAVQKLYMHQAVLDSIEVPEAEVIQRVDYQISNYIQALGSRERMEAEFNKTSTQIREAMRENARDGLIVQRMQQKLVGDIKVTPAEVRRYFKELPQDSIPYVPTQAEVIQRVDYQISNYIQALGSRERMEAEFNKTSTQIREAMRENARDGLIVQRMQQKLVGDIKVTPAEVRRYFKELPQDSIPYVPTQVEVQIITQQPKIPVAEIEDVKRRLREYTDRINKGESDFSTLALLYSEDRGSAIKGGETGFMGKGQMVPEYANVAFNLQDTKKISKIVESEYGFHIIQLIEKRGDRINTRHILLKPKVSDKELDEANARLDSIANDIRSDKFTFDQAASALSQDKDTRNNHGLMQNPQNQTAKFEMQDLPQEIAKVVDKMNIGEISKAFTMVNPKDGKEVCAIVKLKSRINGHKATITDDYQNLKEIVLDKRREEALQKWIVEKQKHTYVRINPAWQRCDFKYPGWIKKD